MTDLSSLYSKNADKLNRKLFCNLYETKNACLPFMDILHWSAMVYSRGLAHQRFHNDIVHIGSGYFYGIHSPVPDLKQILDSELVARQMDAQWNMFPLIRSCDATDHLVEAGYRKIPWFIESIFEISNNVDSDLKFQLGNSVIKNIKRLVRKAEASFDLEFHFVGQMPRGADQILAEFNRLHCLNLDKYKHQKNTHSPKHLKIIQKSDLSKNMLIVLRRCKKSGQYVQGSLNFVDLKAGHLIMVVQGIDHEAISAEHNLYLAETYQIYKWGEDLGIKSFNLGRGGTVAKARLGANRFYLLNHFLKPITRSQCTNEVDETVSVSNQLLSEDFYKLKQSIIRSEFKIFA